MLNQQCLKNQCLSIMHEQPLICWLNQVWMLALRTLAPRITNPTRFVTTRITLITNGENAWAVLAPRSALIDGMSNTSRRSDREPTLHHWSGDDVKSRLDPSMSHIVRSPPVTSQSNMHERSNDLLRPSCHLSEKNLRFPWNSTMTQHCLGTLKQ